MMERVVQSRGAGAQGDGPEGRVVNCEGVEARGVGDRFYNYFHIFQFTDENYTRHAGIMVAL